MNHGSHSLPIHSQFYGYTVLAKIGEGGMGSVYKVAAERTQYALKVILPEYATEIARSRFEREALAAAAVDKHPNIVSIHKLELNAQPPFILMDFVEGQSLDQWIVQDEPWPLEKVIQFLEPLAKALDHMHSKGVIHRDLKPANILIRSHDKAPLITDFGIAKEASLETLTKTGEILGTPEYMAPEQLDNARDVCPQTDVWSLAVIAFELLTGGKKPFHATSLFQLAENLLQTPPDLSPLSDELFKAQKEALSQALQKDPTQRTPTATEFCLALQKQSKAPKTGLKIASAAAFLVFLVVTLFFAFKESPKSDGRATGITERIKTLDSEIRSFQKERLPEHYYQHLCQWRGKKGLSQDHCRDLGSLHSRAQALISEAQESALQARLKRRWASFLFAAAILEAPNKAAETGPKEGPWRFIKALQNIEEPKVVLECLGDQPEDASWQRSWLLLQGSLAQSQGQFRRALKFYEELAALSPKPFLFEGELWLARAKVADAKSAGRLELQFEALFCYWKHKRFAPDFKIPSSVQFGLDARGQLDVQKLNSLLDTLQVKKHELAFRLTLIAMDHGVFLDSFHNANARTSPYTLKLVRENLIRHPKRPSALFWAAYAPPFQRSNRTNEESSRDFLAFQEDMKKALAQPQPKFCKALLLARRAALYYEQEVHNPSAFNRLDVVENCLSDLKQAAALGHPSPQDLHWLKHKVLRHRYNTVSLLKNHKGEIFKALDDYLSMSAAILKKVQSKDLRELAENRPLEIPLARSINYSGYNTNLAKALKARAKIHFDLKEWDAALKNSEQSLKITPDLLLAAFKITSHKELKQFEELKAYRAELQKLSRQSSGLKKREKEEYGRLIASIDEILRKPQ